MEGARWREMVEGGGQEDREEVAERRREKGVREKGERWKEGDRDTEQRGREKGGGDERKFLNRLCYQLNIILSVNIMLTQKASLYGIRLLLRFHANFPDMVTLNCIDNT